MEQQNSPETDRNEKEIAEVISPYFFQMLKRNFRDEDEFRLFVNLIAHWNLKDKRIFINGLRSIALQMEQDIATIRSVYSWLDKFTVAQ